LTFFLRIEKGKYEKDETKEIIDNRSYASILRGIFRLFRNNDRNDDEDEEKDARRSRKPETSTELSRESVFSSSLFSLGVLFFRIDGRLGGGLGVSAEPIAGKGATTTRESDQ